MTPPLWRTLLCAALAGGIGWGIRGQYGHETGAMLAGVLVGFVLIGAFCRAFSPWAAARVVAFLALGVSFGGSETYGQTLGLSHDSRFVGNYDALRWGLLGAAIKGAAWIGLAGAFLGLALGGKRYKLAELALVLAGMLGLLLLGMVVLNGPFDPAHRVLPKLYFSATWQWQPDATNLKPRLERWGGLLLAWLGLLVWAWFRHKDKLTVILGLWGLLAGALGFSLGQCVQSYHAWHAEALKTTLPTWLEPHINWWNAMEISFGTIWGLVLALGVWLNEDKIKPPDNETTTLPESITWVLVAVHTALLLAWALWDNPLYESFVDSVFPMGLLPILLIEGTRRGPLLMALPLVMLPIAVKTYTELCVEHQEVTPVLGMLLYIAVPLGLALFFALRPPTDTPTFARRGLWLTLWLYVALNFAFFRLPWPWLAWTGRTPSGIYYTLAAVVLTFLQSSRSRPPHESSPGPPPTGPEPPLQ